MEKIVTAINSGNDRQFLSVAKSGIDIDKVYNRSILDGGSGKWNIRLYGLIYFPNDPFFEKGLNSMMIGILLSYLPGFMEGEGEENYQIAKDGIMSLEKEGPSCGCGGAK